MFLYGYIQFSNAPSPILVTQEGTEMESKPEHPLNAPSPILVTQDGIEIEARLEQFSKARSQINIVPSFIT